MPGFFREYLMLHRTIIKQLNDLLGAYHLSYSHWTVIHYLKHQGSSTLVDISVHYNVKKPVITRTVHSLQESRLVEQIPSQDRREKLIRLTDSGEEIYATCRKQIDTLEAAVFADIPSAAVNEIIATLQKLRKTLLVTGGRNHE